jgi:chromosome partitioning protein
MAIKISVINFKGGVGKTTLAFHLATYLAREDLENKKVLVVDVDHQSSFSIVILGEKLWEKCVKAQNTSNRVFEYFCNPDVMAGDEIILRNQYAHVLVYRDLISILCLRSLSSMTPRLTLRRQRSVEHQDRRTKRTLLLGDSIGANKNYDYIIFDCPPATKLVSKML